MKVVNGVEIEIVKYNKIDDTQDIIIRYLNDDRCLSQTYYSHVTAKFTQKVENLVKELVDPQRINEKQRDVMSLQMVINEVANLYSLYSNL